MITAADAHRLQNDEDYQAVMDMLRVDALEQLATCNPERAIEIIKLQSRIALIDEFLTELDALVIGAQDGEDSPAPA